MTTAEIRPIETNYAGFRFRSRLEARWAVFFDHLGLRWEYEAQGFLIDGQPYLPDFQLNGDLCDGQGVAAEVKGVLTSDDLQKVLLLAVSRQPVLLLQGIPDDGTDGPDFFLFRRTLGKGNSIGVEASAVGFYPVGDSWELRPFGWAHSVTKCLDEQWSRDHFTAVVNRLNLAEHDGWARVPAQVRSAYSAARQARFEHAERGR